jgi:glutamate carboxypeptidase
MTDLSKLNADDEAARERLFAASADMVARTKGWSAHNTGSTNTAGLRAFAPKLADAFSALEADIELVKAPPSNQSARTARRPKRILARSSR